MDKAIQLVDRSFRALADGSAVNHPRRRVVLPTGSILHYMAAGDPRYFGIKVYSTQLLPPDMKRLADYAQGARLMADEPGERMPPMSVVDYAAVDSGVPAPPYVLSVLGPDHLSNWDPSDMDT